MKLRPLVLLSFIVLVNFFISNDTPVDAERRADDSQMNDPHGPALLFKASKYKTVSATTTGITIRISVAADGTQLNQTSHSPAISAHGRYVSFYSHASNLVSGDTNGSVDIFLHDTQTGQTSRVSVASDGTQGNGVSPLFAISTDGRYVAFRSLANNLVPGDTNRYSDIFLHDTQTGQTSRVSVASDGTQGNYSSDETSVSGDGQYVVFTSLSSNLVAGDTNGDWDVFVHDTQTGQTSRVSVASDGTQGNLASPSYSLAISDDGRYVAFPSDANNLVPGDTNDRRDIFVHDTQTGQTSRVSVSSDGTQGDYDSVYPVISSDGRYVGFRSYARNLVPNDTNFAADIFVHDTQTGQTSRVSVSSDGTQGISSSQNPAISDDGRYVAFESSSRNLVHDDTNGLTDVFVHDRGTESGTYSISGQVTDGNSNPIEGVTLSTVSGSTTTNSSGDYAFTNLITGTYTLTLAKDGHAFTPASSTISLPPDAVLQDFVGIAGSSPPTPFLDLPFDYGSTSQTFVTTLQNWNEDGRVNSWFDHKYPNYGSDNGTGMWLYNGKYTNNSNWSGSVLCFASYCYDGHTGVDFSYKDPQPEVSGYQPLPILAAASGVVVDSYNNCPNYPVSTCGAGFGNYVLLYHAVDNGNGYFTRYGHLASVSSIPTPVNAGDTLGIMGNSGRSSATHLHFGVYKDNGNGQWDGESTDKLVDPYGWKLSEPDPWVVADGPISSWLWLYNSAKQVSFSSDQGALFTDMTGNVQLTIPADAFSGQITLELSPSPVAGASAQLRNGGSSFWLRLLEWLPGVINLQGLSSVQNSNQLTITRPITFTVAYTDSNILHLNESQLALHHWDEGLKTWQSLSTTVNTTSNLVTAQTEHLGGFSLQAPLLCPADDSEPDDSFYRATSVATNDSLINRLFDVAEDQDWFLFNAVAGESYVLETNNLTANVDTIIEVYDQDGLTLLASDDNSGNGAASWLEWTASQDRPYFIRVTPAPESGYGCSAAYALSVQRRYSIYLPVITRN